MVGGRQSGVGSRLFADADVAIGSLHQPELVNVARKGGLAHFESASGEGPLQIFLAGHRAVIEKIENSLLSNKLGHTIGMNIYSPRCITMFHRRGLVKCFVGSG